MPAPARAASVVTWIADGQPTAQALQALELLLGANDHGLDPADYQAAQIAQALGRAARHPLAADQAARVDALLSAAVQRFLSDVHEGRLAGQSLPPGYAVPRQPAFDAAAAVAQAWTRGRVAQAADDLAPRIPLYAELRAALTSYRALVGHAGWRTPLPPLPRSGGGAKVEPGDTYAGLDSVRERLIALGDLPGSVAPSQRYDEPLVAGVKAFQERHGLTVDGTIGRATLAQLEVKPAQRLRQIELALERLRWTPLAHTPRMIVINIPEFVLRAYEVGPERLMVRESMKIIVGKAMDTRTPLFVEAMRFVEFSPYWNVPPSIARAELLPRLRRDPAYWQAQGFEFVTAGGAVVQALSPELLEASLNGGARIRQRPGPLNALGDIKFVFPNSQNIYLHHTPATKLFDRERRDFSHGCIRVERPVALAMFVLRGQPEWTEERVRQAMAAGRSSTVRIAEDIAVLIAYSTSIVKGGRIYFFDDIYGHDRVLDSALRRPRSPLMGGLQG